VIRFSWRRNQRRTKKMPTWFRQVGFCGQSADSGDYKGAISRMEKTLKLNKEITTAFWNPYARATIAFLKRDKPALLNERQILARGLSPAERLNLRKVDGFIRCFECPRGCAAPSGT
jgi:hypothetical protein